MKAATAKVVKEFAMLHRGTYTTFPAGLRLYGHVEGAKFLFTSQLAFGVRRSEEVECSVDLSKGYLKVEYERHADTTEEEEA